MTLRFKGAELRPVIAEAVTNQCRIILVKDYGVYWLAEHGEFHPDGRQKLIAYAIGCNPDVAPFDDWWERSRAEFGGDDFGEFFEPGDSVFTRILDGAGDLEVSATATQIFLQVVAANLGSN
ncbi:DUF3085 domain-containing protein [Candidatus Symbiopectobacterium sp. NZEC135]|uniref:DUF3085 domain-containing protein n=1 Tax=Candidatus Symbiopectobacterium sp. NZEC135 TaxID=2820471 RepID=UPI002226EF5D|nr:DUF3085 domain-containing protein [Candidatus Symbiopectobacterium sp. NZEC135]MCW2478024.1 DUF3085 domain-containing protein [Candidatus Symbiopectobacterium sp. NZEC135]